MNTLKDIRKTICSKHEGPAEVDWLVEALRKEAKRMLKEDMPSSKRTFIKTFFNIKRVSKMDNDSDKGDVPWPRDD